MTTEDRTRKQKGNPDWCRDLLERAHIAGQKAANETNATMMKIVGKDYPEFPICGFAHVNVKPRNCMVAKILLAEWGARKSDFEGGVNMYIHDYQQSYDLKSAYARAFTYVLREAGIRAYSQSRLD